MSELSAATTAGFQPIRLGPRVLVHRNLRVLPRWRRSWRFGAICKGRPGRRMFESAEIGHTIDKKTWRKLVSDLRVALLDAQFDLKRDGKTVIILISGQDLPAKARPSMCCMTGWTRIFCRRWPLQNPPMKNARSPAHVALLACAAAQGMDRNANTFQLC